MATTLKSAKNLKHWCAACRYWQWYQVRVTMNPCEKILAGMKPAIRAYHTGRWLTREAKPTVAEDLYNQWRKRNEKEIRLLADRILDIILKKIDSGELSWDLSRKSSN